MTLSVKSSNSRKKKLSPGVQKAFDNFILITSFGHGGRINNITREALYNFAIYAHKYRVLLGDEQLKELLLEAGAGAEDAIELSTSYFHSRNVLYHKRPWDLGRMYSWLKTKKQREKERLEYIKKRRKNT